MDIQQILTDRHIVHIGPEIVEVDSCHPKFAYWSGDRDGIRNEDGYAKIKVMIAYCNQFDPVYIADEQPNIESQSARAI
jgi:hypothetical protein